MKICTKCKIPKEESEFSPNNRHKDGLSSQCKVCNNKICKNYRKTKIGLSKLIYDNQKRNCRFRGYSLPNYTLKEFREWLFSQLHFERLYKNWVKSGYKKELVPSCDRLNDYKSYNLNNIQLIIWKEHTKKSGSDQKNGINKKQSKAVIAIHKVTREEIKYWSIQESSRQTSVPHGNIIKACQGERQSAGGYYWKYA